MEEVMDQIVTGDETWVHHYEPESMQWHKKGTPSPKKFKVAQSAGKIQATVFWDIKGILLIDYKERVVTITGQYYASLLERLKEAIKEKRKGKLSKGCASFARQRTCSHGPCCDGCHSPLWIRIIESPPKVSTIYSPDLVPSDYYLFPKIKKDLRGKKFDDNEEVESAISAYCDTKDKYIFFYGINKLFARSKK